MRVRNWLTLLKKINTMICRNVYPNNEDHHCDNGFRCSACGDTVEDCENYRVSGTWNYCPKCRAKVVG